MAVQPQQGPTGYPRQWAPKGSPPRDVEPNLEALMLAVDAYLSALSDAEFDSLVLRVRGNGQQQQQPSQYGQQQPQQQTGPY